MKLADDMKEHMDPSEEDVKIMISEVLNEIESRRTKSAEP